MQRANNAPASTRNGGQGLGPLLFAISVLGAFVLKMGLHIVPEVRASGLSRESQHNQAQRPRDARGAAYWMLPA